ncbi:conserved hypothetical protein [Uncinocarpus reesii 1704]|uniref:Nuclear matrix protein n=1 Tax=Uncinocarpus reesii (strain UAMH 1704) TaxID=336963 RepID=C4JH61_UNCRE|nr:uncharacterized protein UREG_02634 [Uncinocarpus reesii 1704]EEP77785.1 conserved hypothetical protein [Uncinocarpus reesii 1704]
MAVGDIRSVQVYRKHVQELLEKATEVKQSSAIEPPVTESDLGDAIRWIDDDGEDASKSAQAAYAAVETAFREKFYRLLATTSINEPNFVDIWNLLDIVSIFSDNERCEPGLIFWLVEELLDSQTIDGCRKVFDYLESRRERNTASFPLGDKSSVNLRGEYHTENITTFDELPTSASAEEDAADVEMRDAEPPKALEDSTKLETATNLQTSAEPDGQRRKPSTATPSQTEDASIDMDALYPIFWGLQASFSSPTRLFDPEHFASFKKGLESTISNFQKVSIDLEKRGMTKGSEETSRRGIKRKRTENGSEAANTFNPKYLTSRDLFELEANDVAFRRHILVQSLIILDFLISLTPRAKAKLADATNKSVLYSYVLSDEDAKWATQMKSSIAGYLQQGLDGKFYYRMVDTVLTRDKNWVRWKAEACPAIEKAPIQVQEYLDTQSGVMKLTTNKRLRATPLGSLDLKFLSEDANLGNLDRLREADRFSNPSPDSYMRGIADDEFNIEMAQNDDEKEEAARGKASKAWRVLRLSSRSKLNKFDKIDDGKNLKILFESPPPEKPGSEVEGGEGQEIGSVKNESTKENDTVEGDSLARHAANLTHPGTKNHQKLVPASSPSLAAHQRCRCFKSILSAAKDERSKQGLSLVSRSSSRLQLGYVISASCAPEMIGNYVFSSFISENFTRHLSHSWAREELWADSLHITPIGQISLFDCFGPMDDRCRRSGEDVFGDDIVPLSTDPAIWSLSLSGINSVHVDSGS